MGGAPRPNPLCSSPILDALLSVHGATPRSPRALHAPSTRPPRALHAALHAPSTRPALHASSTRVRGSIRASFCYCVTCSPSRPVVARRAAIPLHWGTPVQVMTSTTRWSRTLFQTIHLRGLRGNEVLAVSAAMFLGSLPSLFSRPCPRLRQQRLRQRCLRQWRLRK